MERGSVEAEIETCAERRKSPHEDITLRYLRNTTPDIYWVSLAGDPPSGVATRRSGTGSLVSAGQLGRSCRRLDQCIEHHMLSVHVPGVLVEPVLMDVEVLGHVSGHPHRRAICAAIPSLEPELRLVGVEDLVEGIPSGDSGRITAMCSCWRPPDDRQGVA
jgi:hypothetical protein